MWQPTAGFMTHVTCRLTAKNRDQLRNPALGNRVRATFFIPTKRRSVVTIDSVTSFHPMYWIEKTSRYTKAARYATAWLDARTERERERETNCRLADVAAIRHDESVLVETRSRTGTLRRIVSSGG